jgi:hypothetical protein
MGPTREEIGKNLRRTLCKAPVEDVMGWLVKQTNYPTDALNVYASVLAGEFGRLERVGDEVKDYPCGGKTLRIVPHRLVQASQ